ncbi:MAG: hypothetical protein KDD48_05410 [Bdellovibrionales bacterium]|nr:hypothetical protein [Bdellovibrionales bacterium]
MQSYEDIKEIIKGLETIHQEIGENELKLDNLIEKVSTAIGLYANYKKSFSKNTFDVKRVKKTGETLSFESFDWKALDDAHPNSRS